MLCHCWLSDRKDIRHLKVTPTVPKGFLWESFSRPSLTWSYLWSKDRPVKHISSNSSSSTHTHTHSVLTAIFPGEPGLAGCPLNSPFPFIPKLSLSNTSSLLSATTRANSCLILGSVSFHTFSLVCAFSSFFFYSILHWSVAVSTMHRQSSIPPGRCKANILLA